MDKRKADLLVETLGMKHELAGHLGSQEDYQRFEGTIMDILNRYKNRRPRIQTSHWEDSTHPANYILNKTPQKFRAEIGRAHV